MTMSKNPSLNFHRARVECNKEMLNILGRETMTMIILQPELEHFERDSFVQWIFLRKVGWGQSILPVFKYLHSLACKWLKSGK